MQIMIPAIMETLTHLADDCVILAGGSVRDWYLDKPIKDYDFFIESSLSTHEIWDKLDSTVMSDISLASNTEYEGNNNNIIAVFNYNKAGADCQFIFVDKPVRDYVKENFDYDICKCYYDPKLGEFVFTEEFMEDVENKTLTRNCEKGRKYSTQESELILRRWQRLMTKFPDYLYRMKPTTSRVTNTGVS